MIVLSMINQLIPDVIVDHHESERCILELSKAPDGLVGEWLVDNSTDGVAIYECKWSNFEKSIAFYNNCAKYLLWAYLILARPEALFLNVSMECYDPQTESKQ